MISLPRVFISYTNRDGLGRRFAEELRRILVNSWYHDVYFFAHSSTTSIGHLMWEDSGIPSEIDRRDVLILICTPQILTSRPAIREYNIAIIRNKMVVPLRYDEAPVPLALQPEFRDSFDDGNYVQVFNGVAQRLPESYSRFQLQLTANQQAAADLQVSLEQTQPEPRLGQLVPSGSA